MIPHQRIDPSSLTPNHTAVFLGGFFPIPIMSGLTVFSIATSILLLFHPVSSDVAGTVCSIPTVTLYAPWGVALGPSGAFALVTEFRGHRIRMITAPLGAADITTLAGSATRQTGYADGMGAAARFWYPQGIAINAAGTLALVADSSNSAIRQVDVATGAVTTVAGSPWGVGSSDGIGTLAMFTSPTGIAIDAAGVTAIVVSASKCGIIGDFFPTLVLPFID